MCEHLTQDQAYDFLLGAQKRRQKALDNKNEKAQIGAAKDCGVGHFYMGDYRLAIRLFNEAGELIRKTGEHRELLPTVIGMTGRALQRIKQWEDALECYRQAAASVDESNLCAEHLRWRGKEAKTLIDMRRPEEGVPKLEKSVEYGRTLVSSGDPEVLGELAGQLGSLAAVFEETDQARSKALWDEVFDQLEHLPPSRRYYVAATNYAVTLHKWGYDNQSQTYLEEALEIGKQVGADRGELLNVAHRIADTLAELHGFKTAGDWLLAQRSFYGDKQWEVLQHAVDLYERGFFWAEMKHASVEWRKLPIPTPIYVPLYEMTLRYSFACRGVGEFDEALTALEKAGEYAEELSDPEYLQVVRSQMLLVLVDRGDFQKAASLASELWDEGIRDRLLARAFLDALIGTGQINRAEEVREEFKQSGGSELDVAWMTARLADAGVGNPQQAWYDFGCFAHEDRHTECELEALNSLIELYPPRSKEKLEATRQRLRLFDKVRSNVNDIFSDSAWFSVTPKAGDLPEYLDSFLETAIALERNEEAIYELERFRSQMLVDLLAERSARWRRDAPAGIETRSFITDQYDRARYRYQGLLASGASWQLRREAAEELDRLDGMKAGAGGIMHVAPGWQGLHFPQSFETFFDDLKLYHGEALLFQHTFAQQTVFWLMEANGHIQRKSVPGFSNDVLAKLHKAFRGYRSGSADRGPRDLGAELAPFDASDVLSDLQKSLAQPLAKWLKTFALERVFLVAGTAAAILPLCACPSLVWAGIELAVLPTSRALRFTREPRTPSAELFDPVNRFEHPNNFSAARDKIVLVTDPTRSLAYASWETAAVKLAAGDREVELFDQGHVDERRLCRSAQVADVVHLIVHGTFDDASPYHSGVFLKDPQQKDSLWTIADVFSELDAPVARLAVLSGCETGLSRPNLVSEEVSLPSALIAAGFAAVVASKWSVDDLSTALLMGEFYRCWYGSRISLCRALSESVQWLQDLDRTTAVATIMGLGQCLTDDLPGGGATALQANIAKAVKTIEAGPEQPFGYPYYWAAFFVAGDGAITADGVDPRDPSSANSLPGH